MRWARVIAPILITGVVTLAAAQSVQTTFRDTTLFLPAAVFTTNGVAGLTNTAPQLMVAGVTSVSAQLGSISLVTTQEWARPYDGPGHGSDNVSKVVVDAMQNVLVGAYSRSPTFIYYDFAVIKYSKDGTAQWTNYFDGPAHLDEYTRNLGVDAAGNVYVVGDSKVSSNTWDVVTIKYSANGDHQWERHFNWHGTNFHGNSGFAVDAAGNAVVTVTTFYTEPSFITIKYDPQGNAVWTNYYKGSPNGSDFPGTVAVDLAGNVVVNGGSDGTGLNYATLKYNPGGTSLWTNRYVNGFDAIPSDMTLDRDGNVLVTGDVMSPSHVYATVKYSNSGIPLWTNLFPAPNYQGGSVPRVVTDHAGNVFVTGGSPAANGDNADFTTVKYSATGSALWTNRFFEFNVGNPAPAGTAVDSAGNFYFAGHANGPGGTNSSFITVKYAPDGSAVWTNRYTLGTWAQGLTLDHAGNVYVTGLTGGDIATVKYADYIRYTPPTNFTGTDTFTFTAVDPFGNSATGMATIVVLPPTLEFNTGRSNLVLNAQGMRLQVDGARGANPVILYASTNLSNWVPIATNQAVLGSAVFIDPYGTNLPARFYRARQNQ